MGRGEERRKEQFLVPKVQSVGFPVCVLTDKASSRPWVIAEGVPSD